MFHISISASLKHKGSAIFACFVRTDNNCEFSSFFFLFFFLVTRHVLIDLYLQCRR